MTIEQAIKQARNDLAWHVTAGGTVQATIRFEKYDKTRGIARAALGKPDKEQELIDYWRERHDGLGAAIDSVLFVSTPRPF